MSVECKIISSIKNTMDKIAPNDINPFIDVNTKHIVLENFRITIGQHDTNLRIMRLPVIDSENDSTQQTYNIIRKFFDYDLILSIVERFYKSSDMHEYVFVDDVRIDVLGFSSMPQQKSKKNDQRTFTQNDATVELIAKSGFTCPITQDILRDPIFFGGHFYEKNALEQWLFRNNESPLTRSTHNADGTWLEIFPPSQQVLDCLENFTAGTILNDTIYFL